MTQLREEEASKLASFNRLCAEQGLLDRKVGVTDGDFLDGITDDITLLRFLQANRMEPSSALEQYKQARKFQTEKDVLRLYEQISVSDFEDTRKLYPHWTGRRDRHGQPVLMIEMSSLNTEAMAHWRQTREISPDMAQRASVFHDGLTRFVLPLCSAMKDRLDPSELITRSVYIVDASSLSLKQAWDLREFAQDISWILSTCYPETIDRIFVCNVPLCFSQLWKILKNFVDPVTAEKIRVLRASEVYSTLNEYIDPENIPARFGGECKFENGMLPDLDRGIRTALRWSTGWESLPPGPIKWTGVGGGEMKAVATGTVDGVRRNEEIAVLCTENPA